MHNLCLIKSVFNNKPAIAREATQIVTEPFRSVHPVRAVCSSGLTAIIRRQVASPL
jgi:hypothetical protein